MLLFNMCSFLYLQNSAIPPPLPVMSHAPLASPPSPTLLPHSLSCHMSPHSVSHLSLTPHPPLSHPTIPPTHSCHVPPPTLLPIPPHPSHPCPPLPFPPHHSPFCPSPLQYRKSTPASRNVPPDTNTPSKHQLKKQKEEAKKVSQNPTMRALHGPARHCKLTCPCCKVSW